jgi:hypothetical protein
MFDSRVHKYQTDNKIALDQYDRSHERVWAVFATGRNWKRLEPTRGKSIISWVENRPDGTRVKPSEKRVAWLESIIKQAGRYPRVCRFPRGTRKTEALLKKLQQEYLAGNISQTLCILKDLETSLRFMPRETDQPASLWESLPGFDPLSAPPTRWLIKSFVAEGNIQLVYGERGSFKSTLFLCAAKAVASGERFLGMKTRRRRVLYLDYENPANIIKARTVDLGLNLPRNEYLVLWDRFGTQPAPGPEDPALAAIVTECVAETGYGPWIILDSFASLLKPGEGGEFTGQIAPIYLHLRKLADLGATITILDHSRKYDPGTLYGGQDKEAKADSIHTLLVFPNKARPINPIIRVESSLKRAAPKGAGGFAFEVQSRQDRKGNWHIVDLVLAQDPKEAQLQQEIQLLRNLIRQNPNSGQEALATLASYQGIPRDQAITLLKDRAGKDWQVRRSGHNKFSYSLV